MNSDYTQIRTLEQLEEAIAGNRSDIARQEDLMQRSFSRVQAVCTPQNLIGAGVRRATHSYTFAGVALTVISKIRKRLKKK